MSEWRGLLQRGVEHGLLPRSALLTPATANRHPWSLVVLSFLGALLAAIPLVAFVLLLFGAALERHVGPYVFGPLLIVATCIVLRGSRPMLFLENLALVALLIGVALLFFGILRDLPSAGYFVCALLSLALAVAVPVNWLRSLLGALAAATCLASSLDGHDRIAAWYLLLALSALWMLALYLQERVLFDGRHAGVAVALEWTLSGWLASLLIAYAVLAGMAFMATGVGGGSGLASELARPGACRWQSPSTAQILLAPSLVGVSWFWAGRRWPGLRARLASGVAIVVAGLSLFAPSLGPLALLGVVALLTRRRAQAAATAFAAAWVIGSFYYSLCWDLVSKAQVLVAAGLALGLLAFFAGERPGMRGTTREDRPPPRAALIGIALAVVGTLATINVGIWQKEEIIANGRPVFVALAPVDPRSLMQGDYMALNYVLAPDLSAALGRQARVARTLVVARVDERGVASLRRVADATPLGGDEVRMVLSRHGRRWVVASDAWFFKEGDGKRWRAARYGEFRLRPDGEALLVGLVDEKLARIAE